MDVMQAGIPVARLELLDELSVRAANSYFGTSYPVNPTLLMEFAGSAESVEEQSATASEEGRAEGLAPLDTGAFPSMKLALLVTMEARRFC